MPAQLPLESTLEDLFVKKAPPLPDGGKKLLVRWSPWIALVVGILSLLAGLSLWHWAHDAKTVINYANEICATYSGGNCGISTSRLSLGVWLSLIALMLEGVLYLFAFPGLRDRQKQGWNYLYYGALANVAFAVLSLFTAYDAAGNFIGALIGSAIGFYLLFQIRGAYMGLEPEEHFISAEVIDGPVVKEKTRVKKTAKTPKTPKTTSRKPAKKK